MGIRKCQGWVRKRYSGGQTGGVQEFGAFEVSGVSFMLQRLFVWAQAMPTTSVMGVSVRE